MVRRFIHPRILKRLITAIIFGLVLYAIVGVSSRSSIENNDRNSTRRSAHRLSVFRWIENRQKYTLQSIAKSNKVSLNPFSWGRRDNKISQTERNILMDFRNVPLDEKCKYIIDAMYSVTNQWTNYFITRYYGDEKANDINISLLGERLRIFNYCFISGGLEMSNLTDLASVINNDLVWSPRDFIQRMFPFLQQQDELMWPRLIDLNKRVRFRQPSVPNDVSIDNFWNRWIGSSGGKGIAVTFRPSELHLFQRQLRALNKLNNTLPIQVVTSGFEFSDAEIEKLSEYATSTNQMVTLIDCSPILLKEFAQSYIVGFANKWLATVFNTFEEVLLLDVDTVPFIDVKEFFEESQYRATGMALFKDRAMTDMHTYKSCPDAFIQLEPTYQENQLMGTELLFESTKKELPASEAELVYHSFFDDGILHHVDSGLVPIKKTANFNGLLFSFMISLDTKLLRCIHGDKEFFWLGQLYAGLNYTIYPEDAGVIGLSYDVPVAESSQGAHMICGCQLAHVFPSSNKNSYKLGWTNGGLSMCKLHDAAETDFQKYPDYFSERYNTVEKLNQFYTAPLHIQGIVIPDIQKIPWFSLRECDGHLFCASVIKDTAEERNSTGTMIEFTREEQDFFDSISFAWNGRTFTD